MTVSGQTFKPGAIIVHDAGSPDEHPKMALISTIYVANGREVYFKAELYEVTDFNSHYRAFIIEPTNGTGIFNHSQLPLHIPLHPRTCRVLPNDTIVIMPFYISV